MTGTILFTIATLVALGLLFAVVLIVLIWQNVRISRLETENRKLSTRVERLTNELDALKPASGK